MYNGLRKGYKVKIHTLPKYQFKKTDNKKNLTPGELLFRHKKSRILR